MAETYEERSARKRAELRARRDAERKARMAAIAKYRENKMLAGASSNKLAGVVFASDAAQKAAAEEGLSAADFDDKEPSGKSGFTAADVRAIAKSE